MKKIVLFALVFLSLLFTGESIYSQRVALSLVGNWQVKLDSSDKGVLEKWHTQSFGNTITLPGTLDDAGIGTTPALDTVNMNKSVMIGLARKHRYIGAAWYSREIDVPKNFANKQVMLYLERVIWKTDLWIDGRKIGSNSSLVAAQEFIIGTLKPGRHRITLRIDNRRQFDISYKELAHAYTDGTQIIWNGVIGKMELSGVNPTHISGLQAYQNQGNNGLMVKVAINKPAVRTETIRLQATIRDQQGKPVITREQSYRLSSGQNDTAAISLPLKDMRLWDEFDPYLYTVEIAIRDPARNRLIDARSCRYGLRQLSGNKGRLELNGHRLFLRGTLECAIFPLTGHPPMDKAGWVKALTTARRYGLNHLRFHSWCPPEAAFSVADSLGLYLQVELPLWILELGKDKPTLEFLAAEAKQILQQYGNHPSFCLFSLGNELQGDFEWLNTMVASLKKSDPGRLYSTTTFTFEKDHGKWPEKEDDFFVTQWTKYGWIRGQGVFNARTPDFSTDYSDNIKGSPVPVITHEMGQYSVYPDMAEIEKYSGVLDPLNLKAIRHDLRKKGMLELADSFKIASGKHAVNLYKEEIERVLKTDGASGFQLLDLRDFPGQGTALVGLLDAFWDSKGLITPENFRTFCGPVVPLLRFDKATYTNNETFSAIAEIANFSNNTISGQANWEIRDSKGNILHHSTFKKAEIPIGNNFKLGDIAYTLDAITKAEQLTIRVWLEGTPYKNEWKIWVYPEQLPAGPSVAIFTTDITEALSLLRNGKAVVLSPDTAQIKGVPGRYTTVFWSPVHFPDQPGSMGILCNPGHPALKNFPTEYFTNWQWWDLISRSKTIILDDADTQINPIVRVIDNFYKNRKTANMLEFRVGAGKLILSSMDIHSNLENRPAARQLRYSLLQYASGDNFFPQAVLTETLFLNLFKQ